MPNENYAKHCATNGCGFSEKYIYVTNSATGSGSGDPCDPLLSVLPNPISNSNNLVVNVNTPDPCGEINGVASTTSVPLSNQVKIYDFYGNMVYSNTFNSDSMTLNDINLNSGNYILNVFTNNGKLKREILVVE